MSGAPGKKTTNEGMMTSHRSKTKNKDGKLLLKHTRSQTQGGKRQTNKLLKQIRKKRFCRKSHYIKIFFHSGRALRPRRGSNKIGGKGQIEERRKKEHAISIQGNSGDSQKRKEASRRDRVMKLQEGDGRS